MIRRIEPRAVLYGGIVDLTLTFVSGTIVGMLLYIVNDIGQLPEAEQTLALTAALKTNRIAAAAAIFLGCCSSVYAGYVAARVARRDAILHGATAATMALVMSIWFIVTGKTVWGLMVSLLMLPLGPILGALGGYIWLRRQPTPAPGLDRD